MTTINTSDFMTTAQAGKVLGLGTDTVRVYCNIGTIRGTKIGNGWMIHKTEVQRYAKERNPPGRPS